MLPKSRRKKWASSRLRYLLGHLGELGAGGTTSPSSPLLASCQVEAASAKKTTSGPLVGLKVLDLCQFQNGPSATARLADNGADVVKVEPPDGDNLRALQLLDAFEAYNRGKRSVALDLKHPGSKDIFKRLVEWADVLTENFRPDVMERLGLGYEVCKAWNPKLIYACCTGYGVEGEWALRASYNPIAQAFTGAATSQAGGPDYKPKLVEWAFSDEVGAVNFYASIMDALYARSITGRGQRVTTSQTAATVHFQRASIIQSAREKRQKNDGRPAERIPVGAPLQASDGKWFQVSMGKRAQFEMFVNEVLQAPGLLETPGGKAYPLTYVNTPDGDALNEAINAVIATHPRQHWLDLCNKPEISVPCAPHSTYAEVVDPEHTVGKHLRANELIAEVEHRDFGTKYLQSTSGVSKYTTIAQPTKYHDTPNLPVDGSWHAPDIGEHTTEVLRGIGYSFEEAQAMQKQDGPAPPGRGPWARTDRQNKA